MKYRALTVSRQFGSGGGRIANTIAEWLGWKLLDNEILSAIARAARVDSKVVRHYDERVDSGCAASTKKLSAAWPWLQDGRSAMKTFLTPTS